MSKNRCRILINN